MDTLGGGPVYHHPPVPVDSEDAVLATLAGAAAAAITESLRNRLGSATEAVTAALALVIYAGLLVGGGYDYHHAFVGALVALGTGRLTQRGLLYPIRQALKPPTDKPDKEGGDGL